MKEAQDDFISAITTKDLDYHNQVGFHRHYGFFFLHQEDSENACKHFKKAIEYAIQHCTKKPLTPQNLIPEFDGALWKDLNMAKDNYQEIMEKKMQSTNLQTQNEGLEGFFFCTSTHWCHKKMTLEYMNAFLNR